MSCQQLEGHVKSFYVNRAQIVLNGFERPDDGFGPKEGQDLEGLREKAKTGSQSLVFVNLAQLVMHDRFQDRKGIQG